MTPHEHVLHLLDRDITQLGTVAIDGTYYFVMQAEGAPQTTLATLAQTQNESYPVLSLGRALPEGGIEPHLMAMPALIYVRTSTSQKLVTCKWMDKLFLFVMLPLSFGKQGARQKGGVPRGTICAHSRPPRSLWCDDRFVRHIGTGSTHAMG